MFEQDIAIIRLMVETLEKIFMYTSDLNNADEFENDTESFDATLMNFIVIGESITKLTDDFKNKHKQIDWRKIYAFRNILAHDYFGILPEEVWEIIIKHLPRLMSNLKRILEELKKSPN